ncbi:hypothetical protein ACFW3D_30330 [Streptomyces sp. NPDC058864]
MPGGTIREAPDKLGHGVPQRYEQRLIRRVAWPGVQVPGDDGPVHRQPEPQRRAR